MKSLRKKSVHSRKLTYLTAFTMVLALAGCSNTDDESPDLEETTDASVSDPVEYIPASEDGPAENVPEPRLPAEATESSQEGALKALDHFWESAQFARLTGDASALESISATSCDFCSSFAADWRAAYEEGKWAVSEGDLTYNIREAWTSEEDGTQSLDVLFTLSEPSTKIYAEGGRIEQESANTDESSDWFALMYYDATSQRWEVAWIGLEELVSWED